MARFIYNLAMNLKHIIPEQGVYLQSLLAPAFELRMVGGAVRDALMGLPPKDFDFATDAKPEEMIKIFRDAGLPVIETGISHGTIIVLLGGPLELTTLRVDLQTDGRHAVVEYTKNWEADAARRDFTFNAMSIDMEGNLHDYFGGQEDLAERRVRFVGDPAERICEDYLRILRYFRFCGKMGVGFPQMRSIYLDEPTWAAIRKYCIGLKDFISGERIAMEMRRILVDPMAGRLLQKMNELGVLAAIDMPEEFSLDGVLCALDTDRRDPMTVLAAALSGRQVQPLIERWKLTADEQAKLTFLMVHYDEKIDLDELKLLAVQKNIPKSWVDDLALICRNETLYGMIRDWSVPTFPVQGRDLLAAGMEAGPEMGKRLRRLHLAWINSDFVLTKEELLKA